MATCIEGLFCLYVHASVQVSVQLFLNHWREFDDPMLGLMPCCARRLEFTVTCFFQKLWPMCQGSSLRNELLEVKLHDLKKKPFIA